MWIGTVPSRHRDPTIMHAGVDSKQHMAARSTQELWKSPPSTPKKTTPTAKHLQEHFKTTLTMSAP